METSPQKHDANVPLPLPDDPVVNWLLEGDPAIRWQVMRDLLDAPQDEVAAERARVEHEGWGAGLLAQRAPDGRWAGGACFPDTAAFAEETARALAAGEPLPPFPFAYAEPAPGGEPEQPWTATYPVLLDLCHLHHLLDVDAQVDADLDGAGIDAAVDLPGEEGPPVILPPAIARDQLRRLLGRDTSGTRLFFQHA